MAKDVRHTFTFAFYTFTLAQNHHLKQFGDRNSDGKTSHMQDTLSLSHLHFHTFTITAINNMMISMVKANLPCKIHFHFYIFKSSLSHFHYLDGESQTSQARPLKEERRDMVLPVVFVSRFFVILDEFKMIQGAF